MPFDIEFYARAENRVSKRSTYDCKNGMLAVSLEKV